MCLTHQFMITKCLFITAVMLPFLADTRAIASTIEEAQKLQQGGRYSEAITIYEKVLTENPKDTAAAANQAYCYERLGDFRLAARKIYRCNLARQNVGALDFSRRVLRCN